MPTSVMYVTPRVYVKKMPNTRVRNSFIKMEKIGKMIEGDMGRMGVNITSKVVFAMERQIERERKRKNPIGKHDRSLEPWRLTAGRNLIAVLRESVDIRKQEVGGKLRYTFLLGQKSFLKLHSPYWAMLNYGGKISIDAKGVPGYFGAGQLPSGLHNDQSFHWTGSSTFIKKKDGGPAKSPIGTRIGLMIPKKLIVGIHYIGAGYQEFLNKGQEGIQFVKDRIYNSANKIKRGEELKVDPILSPKELLKVIKRYWV